jgi:hypothetical protein
MKVMYQEWAVAGGLRAKVGKANCSSCQKGRIYILLGWSNALAISGEAMTSVPNGWLINVPSPGGDNICGVTLNERKGLATLLRIKDRSRHHSRKTRERRFSRWWHQCAG